MLGRQALCITADSPSYPERHRALALRIAADFALHHEIIRTNEMANPDYRANPANRCYFYKHELYTHLSQIARSAAFRRSPTAAMPTTAVITVPAVRQRESSVSSAPSMLSV